MKKSSKILLVAALVIFVAVGAFAQFRQNTPHQKMTPGKRFEGRKPQAFPLLRILQSKKDELKVTDDQISKIK